MSTMRSLCGVALSAVAVACSADGSHEQELVLGTAAQGLEQLEPLGFQTHTFGHARTSRCAVDVRGAFRRLPSAPSGRVRYRSRGGNVLPPVGARLADFGDWDSHVQSFVRLSLPWDDNLWAVVSRANPGSDGGAGVFLVHLGDVNGADGTRWVLPGEDFGGDPPGARSTALYYPIAGTDHPGGVQVSGEFLVVASEGPEGQPAFVDVMRRATDDVSFSPLQRFTLHGDLGEPVTPTRFITAAALTRLRQGPYLLFVLGKDEDQQGWFYVSEQTSLSATTTWRFLDHVAMPWSYQNVALVTECDTRQIYLVATNNVAFDGREGSGDEYADLMQVSWDQPNGEVDLPLVDLRDFSAGSGGYCTFRAAASPFIDASGELLLYCHAYKANTDLLGRPDSKLKLVEYAP